MQIVLDQKAIAELNNFIQDLPLKYGLPLLNFLNQKISEQSVQNLPSLPQQEVKID